MDISGKSVYADIPYQDVSKLSVNLAEFAAGIYFLRVQVGEYTTVKKVIKGE